MVKWKTKRLGEDVLKIGYGKTQHEIVEINGKYPILATGGEIGHTNYFLYDKPSVLIGRKGTIDKPQYMDTPFWAIDTLFYSIVSTDHSAKYLYYLFCTIDWNKYNEASGVPSLSAKIIENIKVNIPPLSEQRRIAEVLSDTDALVSALEKLIAKKRAIKQGAMQELLTGKRRLPGFSGEWVNMNLAENSTLKARIGWQGLTTVEYLDSGYSYLITGTDFINGKIAWETCHYVDKYRYDQDTNIQITNGDVLITKDGTIGKIAIVSELKKKATLNSGVFVLRPKTDTYDHRYVYYVLLSQIFIDFLDKLAAGSTINHLYQKDFVNFEFVIPPTVAEQTAIASILSDMDAEIEALLKKLNKLRNIKQGMMSELLTGHIRLIDKNEEVFVEEKPGK
jgi:type I restriction enzyme S subunit